MNAPPLLSWVAAGRCLAVERFSCRARLDASFARRGSKENVAGM